MFTLGFRNALLALSAMIMVAMSAPYASAADQKPCSVTPKTQHGVRTHVKHFMSRIGKILKSDSDYVDDSPTDQFIIN